MYLSIVRQLLEDYDRVVAIGEIGLDYSSKNSKFEKDDQKIVFTLMLNLAVKHDMPVILHVRNANQDARAILTEVGTH